MKKLFILYLVAMLGALSAMGQGQVNLNPAGTGVYLEIYTGGVPVKVGTPAVAAGFTGFGPGQVAITVWGAPQGTALATAEATTPLFTGFNLTSTLAGAQGLFNAGGAFNLTTANVSGWNGTGPLEFIFTATIISGYTAEAEAQNITAATGIQTPTPVFGSGPGQISEFAFFIPEPSTLALGCIGAAGLFFFPRRK